MSGLDSVLKAEIVQKANKDPTYYQRFSWQERLEIANYLNSIAYNYPEDYPPKLDKTKFKAWSIEDQNKAIF